jgi:hypothetical protein
MTQSVLAARLGDSLAKINKTLAHGHVVPELLPLAKQFEEAVVPLIAN